jgi:Domain of unknown function (DUF4333)
VVPTLGDMSTLIRAVCVGLAAVSIDCGGETLDASKLEAEIKKDLTADVGVAPKAIACPEDVGIEQGKRFQCTGTAPNGDTFDIAVELTNDDGGFEAVVPPEQFE